MSSSESPIPNEEGKQLIIIGQLVLLIMLTILASITLGILCHFYYTRNNRRRQVRPAFKENNKQQQKRVSESNQRNKNNSDNESLDETKLVNYTEVVYDLNGRRNYAQKQRRVRETSNGKQELSAISEFSPVEATLNNNNNNNNFSVRQLQATPIPPRVIQSIQSPILPTRHKINQKAASFRQKQRKLDNNMKSTLSLTESDNDESNRNRGFLKSLKNVFTSKSSQANKSIDLEYAKKIRRPSPEQY